MKTILFTLSIFILFLNNSCQNKNKSACYAYGSGTSAGSGNGQGNVMYYRKVNESENIGRLNKSYYLADGKVKNVGDLESIQTRRMYSNGDQYLADEEAEFGEDPLSKAKKDLPDVATAYERYNPFEENDWITAGKENRSTFGIDVDNASYTNFRRFANQGQLPPKDAIRMEEWLNFFNYDLEAPESSDQHPLKITTEIGPCPWNEEDDLVMIKLQAKRAKDRDLPPSNLVFLVDVSGSMNSPNKLPLVQTSMHKLVEKLRPDDHMSIVTYAGSAGVVLQPTSGSEKDKIQKAIDGLKSGGGTAGSEGIKTAYELAEKNLLPDGNNRVIVATDGDWNIGITDKTDLKKVIEGKRSTGVYLSVLGFGMYNLNDEMMESLADNGNGNYGYIDSEKEADRIFNAEFSGSMYVVAKDVKLQVHFDSLEVEKYRLIGYENRVLENWQFEADSIDAGDLGMGQNVIAFYQVKRKYPGSTSLGKIDFRYKPIKGDVSTLLSVPMSKKVEQVSSDYKYASCVVEFALCLRESEFRDEASMSRAIARGKQNLGNESNKLSYEKRVEFVGLMEKTAEMWEGYVIEKAPEITEDKFPELKLYPNPASTETTVEVPEMLKEAWSVQVLTMNGQLMKVQHFNDTTTGKIDLIGLKPETYLIKVYGSGINFGYLRLVVSGL